MCMCISIRKCYKRDTFVYSFLIYLLLLFFQKPLHKYSVLAVVNKGIG